MKKDSLADVRNTQSSRGFFGQIDNRQAYLEIKISDEYRGVIKQYYQATHYVTKNFIVSQLSRLRLEHEQEAQAYLEWFENNLENLTVSDFGKFELFEQAKPMEKTA
ncbi:hypothetical protein [Legionella sp. 16cNR16C]|uniref:hypothetical protein n=1 Tax=Legionella sp. 16cNR16C TaxID=2905656 RepID=UPI001E5F3139|nr:hypothetical protein [Legionella sp. 16cNR16C]MCE3045934.1 hypothetical protein [Legionella sp. 16cNR16C]